MRGRTQDRSTFHVAPQADHFSLLRQFATPAREALEDLKRLDGLELAERLHKYAIWTAENACGSAGGGRRAACSDGSRGRSEPMQAGARPLTHGCCLRPEGRGQSYVDHYHSKAWALTGRMTRIELAPEVLDDFDRFIDHLARFEEVDIPRRLGEIMQAIENPGSQSLDRSTRQDG
jgi:hypothetical protein